MQINAVQQTKIAINPLYLAVNLGRVHRSRFTTHQGPYICHITKLGYCPIAPHDLYGHDNRLPLRQSTIGIIRMPKHLHFGLPLHKPTSMVCIVFVLGDIFLRSWDTNTQSSGVCLTGPEIIFSIICKDFIKV